MKTTPKDFFLHLGAAITLYASAIALFNLYFSIIDYVFPDSLAGYFSSQSVAWPISMLVVLVPLLYILEKLINRDIRRTPEKREIGIRRFRVYLTLFLTGATIAGDLIALINTYLNGEISERFSYKVLAIFLVSSVIFAYYILSRGEDTVSSDFSRAALSWFGIFLVFAGIVGGFIIVGSPSKQRALRFDNQRIEDLFSIQSRIVDYWQKKGKLPTTLRDLNDSVSGYTVPTDPDTHYDYIYADKGGQSFELCAVFSLSNKDSANRGKYYRSRFLYLASPYQKGDYNDIWKHEIGNSCFERSIDPQQYPIKP